MAPQLQKQKQMGGEAVQHSLPSSLFQGLSSSLGFSEWLLGAHSSSHPGISLKALFRKSLHLKKNKIVQADKARLKHENKPQIFPGCIYVIARNSRILYIVSETKDFRMLTPMVTSKFLLCNALLMCIWASMYWQTPDRLRLKHT